MKEAFIKIWNERIWQKSTAGAVIVALVIWLKWDVFSPILDEYLKTPEFKGMAIGWIQSLVAYLFIKRG